jgi:[acyl-carrier-protein] S-malonyltransferase
MGKDLAARFPAARALFETVDAALGVPLSRLMFEGPEDELTATHNAQPAILAHTAAVFAVVGPALGATAVAAAGHSLGEYSAYVTAGALAPADAAVLVRRRGELMHQAGRERPGTMAAVLGLAAEEVEAVCREVAAAGGVVVAANLNAPDQTVISGEPEAVARAGEGCRARGAKRVLPLKVSGAFHSPLMAPAAAALHRALEAAPFRDPAFPVIANATAEPVCTAAAARRLLAEQLTAPVRWVACMQRAAALARVAGQAGGAGNGAGGGARFVEIGPGAVLAGLLRRIVPEAEVVSLGTADEVARFLATA